LLNWKLLAKILSFIVMIIGLSMLPALISAYIYDDMFTVKAFLIPAAISIIGGGICNKLIAPKNMTLRLRDGYLVVALCWILASLIGAFPYYISAGNTGMIDAIFESVSGFTTTGCTVAAIDALPKSLLFWKAITHWLGGMGILVFVIAILPALGIGGQTIARVETPGPTFEKVATKTSDSTKLLYLTYIVFTIIEFLLLWLGSDMGAFDALINTMGSISTGGLFAHTEGIGYYDSVYVEFVISIFCFLGSVSFAIYFLVIRGRWKEAVKDVELRVYSAIIIVATILMASNLYYTETYNTFASAIRHSSFQIISFVSTAGYAIADYTAWPPFSQSILFILMFVGGCGASTCGGMKVMRVIVSFKLIARMFFKRLHPNGVIAVVVGGKAIPAQVVSKTSSFMVLYILVFIVSVFILSLQNLDFETTIGYAAGALGNTGLGFGELGSTGNFDIFGPPMRLYFCFMMLMGRLELFALLIIFTPAFWKTK